MKKPGMPKAEQNATHKNLTLGALKLTKATDQSYIQNKVDTKGKWTLLVAVSSRQTRFHHEMAEALFEQAENNMNKPNLVALRNQWLQAGSEPPFADA